MHYGFTNALAIFMNIMSIVLKIYLGVFTFEFMDDIYIYNFFSKTRGNTRDILRRCVRF